MANMLDEDEIWRGASASLGFSAEDRTEKSAMPDIIGLLNIIFPVPRRGI